MSEMVKIAFIEPDARIGGAEVNLISLLERLDRKRFSPIVIVPYEGPLTVRLKELGVPFRIIHKPKHISTSMYILEKKIFNPFAVLYDIFALVPVIFKIKTFLKTENMFLVYTNSMVTHIYGSIAARLAGIPCIWHLQDIVDPQMAFGIVRRSLVWLGGFLPRKIIVISNAVGAMFDGKSSARVRVIYNGTDCKRFSPDIDCSNVRKEFGINDNEFAVGMAGRLVEWKGQRQFLKAAAVVLNQLSNSRFFIIGDAVFGPPQYKKSLFRLAEKLGIASKVIFTGQRKDIHVLIRSMDVMVHASILPEPFGLVITEAMASGVPIIAAAYGGPTEIIEHDKDGFLVDPQNEDDLAAHIIRLLKDASLRERLSRSARMKVIKKFSIERFVSEFEEVYEEVLNSMPYEFR